MNVLVQRQRETTSLGAAPRDAVGLLNIPVTAGELIDKITILTLKTRRVQNPQKKLVAAQELGLLRRISTALPWLDEVAELALTLEDVNAALWDVEDRLRDLERQEKFDEEFVEAARSVYRLNDERARLKNAISAAAGCVIYEVKEHPAY